MPGVPFQLPDTHAKGAKIVGASLIVMGVFAICLTMGLYQVRYHSSGSYPERRSGDPSWGLDFATSAMNVVGGILMVLAGMKRNRRFVICALIWSAMNAPAQIFLKENYWNVDNGKFHEFLSRIVSLINPRLYLSQNPNCDIITPEFGYNQTICWFRFDKEAPKWRSPLLITVIFTLQCISSQTDYLISIVFWFNMCGIILNLQALYAHRLQGPCGNIRMRLNLRIKQGTIIKSTIANVAMSIVSMFVGLALLFVMNYGVYSGKNDMRYLTIRIGSFSTKSDLYSDTKALSTGILSGELVIRWVYIYAFVSSLGYITAKTGLTSFLVGFIGFSAFAVVGSSGIFFLSTFALSEGGSNWLVKDCPFLNRTCKSDEYMDVDDRGGAQMENCTLCFFNFILYFYHPYCFFLSTKGIFSEYCSSDVSFPSVAL